MATAAQELFAQGFHLSDKFFDEFHDGDTRALYEEALNCDLRRFGAPALRSDFHAATSINGPVCLQLLSVHNVAQPSARQSTPGLHPQLLQLRLTDGTQKVTALEVGPVPQLSVTLAPGTKVHVQDCRVRNGKLLLNGTNCAVLGGKVYELFTSWKANKELKEKKRVAGADQADPPPSFTEFVVSKKNTGSGSGKASTEKSAKQAPPPAAKPKADKGDEPQKQQVAPKKKDADSKNGKKKSDAKKDGAAGAGSKDRKEAISSKAGGPSAKQKKPKEKHTKQQPPKAQDNAADQHALGELPPKTQLRVESKEFVPSFLQGAAAFAMPPPPPASLRPDQGRQSHKELTPIASKTKNNTKPSKKQSENSDKRSQQHAQVTTTDTAEVKVGKPKKPRDTTKDATEKTKMKPDKTGKNATPKRSGEKQDSKTQSGSRSEAKTSEKAAKLQPDAADNGNKSSKAAELKRTPGTAKTSAKPAQMYVLKQSANLGDSAHAPSTCDAQQQAKTANRKEKKPPQKNARKGDGETKGETAV
uniref:RecQ-mediated genome instability protein 1 n=1 Tax=Globisporangium ultimum (strain ATCC 200006 / CBS 805.95 / DAOM BR144) TaxID=431595 RepID=K3XC70_GLOUD